MSRAGIEQAQGWLWFPKAAAKAAAKSIGISEDIPGDHAKKQRAKGAR